MNPKSVHLSDRALRELVQVARRYSSEVSPQFGRTFVAALHEALQHLSFFPGSGSPRYGHQLRIAGLRSWPVRGFPYLVLYAEQESSIDVYRLLHTARDIPESLSDD